MPIRQVSAQQRAENIKKKEILNYSGYNVPLDGSWGPWFEQLWQKVSNPTFLDRLRNAIIGAAVAENPAVAAASGWVPTSSGRYIQVPTEASSLLASNLGVISGLGLAPVVGSLLAGAAPAAVRGLSFSMPRAINVPRMAMVLTTGGRALAIPISETVSVGSLPWNLLGIGAGVLGTGYALSNSGYRPFYAEDGEEPAPTPEPTPAPTPEPTPAPTPEPTPEDPFYKRLWNWAKANPKKAGKRTVVALGAVPTVATGVDLIGNTIGMVREPFETTHDWRFPLLDKVGSVWSAYETLPDTTSTKKESSSLESSKNQSKNNTLKDSLEVFEYPADSLESLWLQFENNNKFK